MDELLHIELTDKAKLLLAMNRVERLEQAASRLDRALRDLHLYVRTVEGLPDAGEWELVREQIWEMVDEYGPRSADR